MGWVTIFLIVFLVILALYLAPLLFGGVPFGPTPEKSITKMFQLSGLDENDVVYDLGCGTGRILKKAAAEFGAKGVGIEINPVIYLVAKLNVFFGGFRDKIEVKFGNFYKRDLSEATVVTVFQSKGTNEKLREKLEDELKAGSRVVSYHWRFNEWEPIESDQENKVYLYEIN